MAERSKKNINAVIATAVGLGAIIGAGIFVLSGTAVVLAGADALIAFVLVGVVALIIALELGELGSIMPNERGASYSYTYNAFGSELGFITGMLRYTALATSISAIALGFGSYLSSVLGFSVATYSIPFAIILIAVLSLVNILGVKKAAEADFALVTVKIIILLAFIAFAVFIAMTKIHVAPSNFSLDFSVKGIEGIFAASVAIFFAYSGFQSISTITDRIKGGASGYVKSLIAAVIISIAVYTAVVFGLLLLHPASAYTVNADPLSFALKGIAPPYLLIIIDIGALIATASATIAMILASSRSLLQMSDDGLLPKFLRKYNSKRDTAINGIIVSAIIGVIMLFSGNIYVIASIANFGLMFDYLIIGFDVIHFRRRKVKAPFKTPLYPYLPIIGSVAILTFFIGMPKEALAIGSILIISLIAIYYFFREAEKKRVIKIRLFK